MQPKNPPVKLTDTIVRKLSPPPPEQKGVAFYWDSNLKGFGLTVTKAGTKTFIVQGRVNGRERRMKLARHGVLTAEQARKKARVKLGQMADSIDPVSEKRRKEALGVTLEDVVKDYIENKRPNGVPLKESTIRDIRRHLKTNFKPWKTKPLVNITRDMVERRYKKHCKTSVSQAGQSMAYLRAVFQYAIDGHKDEEGRSLIAHNPVDVLKDKKMLVTSKPKKGHVPLDKIGEWWSAVQKMRNDPAQEYASNSASDLVAVIALTGLRLGEARSMKWPQLDLNECSLELYDTKNRTDVILPLSDRVVEILGSRKGNKSDYVFPARYGKGHLKDCRAQREHLAEATGVTITNHDLRRTFSAVAAEVNVELWRTKALMNHKQRQDVTLHHYKDLSDVRFLKPEIDRITEYFEEQRGIYEAGNVVSITERRA
jgi:integrase